MPDVVDRETRSRMMARIKGKNTAPELALRKAMHARGFRFRLHAKDVPGHPDLLLPKFKVAIFVNGCFWHRHKGCSFTTTPATRTEFWLTKFAANVARDAAVRNALAETGWRRVTVWACALQSASQVEAVADFLAVWLPAASMEVEVGEADVPRHLLKRRIAPSKRWTPI